MEAYYDFSVSGPVFRPVLPTLPGPRVTPRLYGGVREVRDTIPTPESGSETPRLLLSLGRTPGPEGHPLVLPKVT